MELWRFGLQNVGYVPITCIARKREKDFSYEIHSNDCTSAGIGPFHGKDQLQIFMAILMKEPSFPEQIFDNSSKLFIKALLEKNPENRLKSGSYFIQSTLKLTNWKYNEKFKSLATNG